MPQQTNRARIRQIHFWLLDTFPLPFKDVYLRLEKMPLVRDKGIRGLDFGKCDVATGGATGIITLEQRRDLGVQIDTLLHEHGHLDVYRLKWRPDHSNEWALAYGRRYRRFVDEGGAEESRGWKS